MTAGVDSPIRVLLVEDNPGDSRLILELLRNADHERFEVATADRLDRAIAHLNDAVVDVVLLDLGLPDSQGLDTFERMHRAPANVPIVVISGLDDERMALDSVRAGAQDYLVKGQVDGRLLTRVLRYAIERQRTEQWIRRLSLAVDQSPASVFITNTSGTIEYVNARFTEITGYPPEDALGRTPRLLQSGLTPPAVYSELWNTILKGETWRGELQNRRKDGAVYWDSAWISPIRDAGGRVTHFLALQEDVSERRAMVEELREREERFRQVTEGIREVFFLSKSSFREMLYVSPAYEEIWQRSRQSLYDAPRSFLDAVFAEDQPALLQHIEQARQGGEAEPCEYRLRRPDGDVRSILVHTTGVLNDQGDVYRLAGVALDITKRRIAEDALRASERRLRTLFETVNLIVLALDMDGKVDYLNPFLLQLTGYTSDEVVGTDWFQRFIPAAQRGTVSAIFADLLALEAHPHYTNPIITKAGEERMISWHNTVLRDPLNRPIGTLSIGEDITEQLRLEAQLRQSQKMEAVGRLAGGVAHDFNNLLTVILGTTEILLAEAQPSDPMHVDLTEIKSAGERAAGLTRQLLAFSRQQVLEPRVIDLNALIPNVERMLGRIIGEDIQLHAVLADGLGSVLADPGQIEQVILNLAVNSRDAMPQGGMLTIETANVDLDADYASDHVSVRPGRYVMLAVTDTGTGMDAATRAQIFDPFFTTKPKGKGTGLGLSTVYGIVKQSGGVIWLYSEPGRGATFKIYLPRVHEPTESHEPLKATASVTGTETILSVEDEEAVRTITRKMLEKRGYRVFSAASGEEALRIVEEHPGSISLLITDVIMPAMSGRVLAEQLEQIQPKLQVLYVSGYTDEAIMQHGVLAEGVNFLQKPFTAEALARKVRQVLDESTGA
jgi:two-component system cell cycle sensor histidine kinase/response regulator CckA